MTNEQNTSKKNNNRWGYGLAVVYICFMTLILSLVFLSTSQKFELVSEDYYQESVDYQKVLDAQHRVTCLLVKPELIIGDRPFISIPDGLKVTDFEIILYRPNDSKLDQKILVSPDGEGKLKLPQLPRGSWQVFLKWQDSKKDDYQQHWKIIL